MAPSQVFLRTLSGNLSVVHASTVGELRAAADPESRIVSGTRDLTSVSSETGLAKVGVCNGTTVYELARLVGGGKKRKKKTYTKPKKLKHKHTKVKMATLKYYKINDDGKVERLRHECPQDTCGAGIFMAEHHDRFYCGKCGSTRVPAGKA
jgi:ubiquitin-small subunit ribosomal protein S27Ae